MKDMFSMYYVPDEKEFERIWDECIFIFDANVLLNLYRYSISTTELFLSIIDKLSERVWLPHQVALEYHANRTSVIYEQSDAYNNVRQKISQASTDLFQRLDKDLKSFKKRHPVIEVNKITERIDSILKSINKELEQQEQNHPNYIQKDTIRDSLEKAFVGKVGGAYTEDEYKKIFGEGERRYKLNRAPGYSDSDEKKDKRKYYQGIVIEDQYGDLIVWKQILDKAKTEGKPVIFVTDDAKEDWWKKDHGKTIGPKMELVDEFIHNTGQSFYMYESYRFIEFSQNYLKQKINRDAIIEVQEYKKYLEEMASEIEAELNSRDNNDLKRIAYKLSSRVKSRTYVVGDKVEHKKWGIGTVVQVSGEKDAQEVKIAFPKPYGMKHLIAKYAPIERISQKSFDK